MKMGIVTENWSEVLILRVNKTKRTVADNILRDKPDQIALNLIYDWYQKRLASMVHNLSDKKTRSGTKANVQA